MSDLLDHCATLSDEDLVGELKFLAERERRDLGGVLAHLAEFDRRRLAQKHGHDSTFMFCLRVLKYDEGGSYRRVHAARAIRRYRAALPMVQNGSLGLTSILLLSPILNEDNHTVLLKEVSGKSKREVELLVAGYDPRPPLPDSMRRLPAPPPPWAARSVVAPLAAAAPGLDGVPAPPAALEAGPVELSGVLPSTPPREWQAIMPLSLERVRIGFDAAAAVMRLIDRARQVLRHKYPDGRLEDIVKEALEILLDRKDPQRRLAFRRAALVRDGAASAAPAAAADPSAPRFLRRLQAGRYVPARVKRAVWQRDDGRCAWRFEDGRPCGSRDGLEYDHLRPFARGGRSDDPRNIRLLCRTHNQEAARAVGLISAAAGAA